jgi:hypothetical protein
MMASVVISLLSLGVLLVVVGHYQRQIDALSLHPVTKVRIVPRTLYEEQMGVDWTSQNLAPI